MTREVIGRWPLVVEVDVVEGRFRFKVREQDREAIPVGFTRDAGGLTFDSRAVPALGSDGVVFLRGTADGGRWTHSSWPASRLPEFRSAVEQLVEELRAEHLPPSPPEAVELARQGAAMRQELRAEHAPPAEEIDLCGLEPCRKCGLPKYGDMCRWCHPADRPFTCASPGSCMRTIPAGRGHPYCEDCQRKHATGRSPEAGFASLARTTSPDRPEERPTYCAKCGERTPCGATDEVQFGGETRQIPHTDFVQLPADQMGMQCPLALTPEARAAWHAEHNPGREADPLPPCPYCGAPPNRDDGFCSHNCALDHELDRLRAEQEKPTRPICTAAGCDRTRKHGMLYCDPCGGRLTIADVDPYNLTKWRPVEDEPEEELRVTGESIPMASSVRDAAQQSFERHRLIGESVDVAADLYAHLDVCDLTAARREYARLGELLRELEGEL